jgi:sugar phosphate isomerase/epimerase
VIAISTCAYPELPLPAALERIGQLTGAVEVRCKGRHGIDTVSQNRALARSGLRCSVHAPEEIAIWSRDEARRQAAVTAHERLLEAAAAAGAELYLVHPDYSERPIVECAETETALQRSFATLHELEAVYLVRVAVENMPGRNHSHFATPQVDRCGLGLALDAGHAQISGTLEAFLETPEIAHLHLHDNRGYGDVDRHLPLGRGRLAPEVVGGLLERCDGLCVLEHADEAQVYASLGFIAELRQRREVA